jgi:hypothetical protein
MMSCSCIFLITCYTYILTRAPLGQICSLTVRSYFFFATLSAKPVDPIRWHRCRNPWLPHQLHSPWNWPRHRPILFTQLWNPACLRCRVSCHRKPWVHASGIPTWSSKFAGRNVWKCQMDTILVRYNPPVKFDKNDQPSLLQRVLLRRFEYTFINCHFGTHVFL